MAAPMLNVMRNLICNSVRNNIHRHSLVLCRHDQRRFIQEMRKFYKNATVVTADGWYEINLDNRKLRTPIGTLFRIPNETLALAVATEWNAQKDTIQPHTMHLNSLCNTAIDNPMHRTRDELVDSTIHFLETDTICYRMNSPPDLKEFLEKGWDPLIHYAKERHGIVIHPTLGIVPPEVSDNTKDIIRRYLLSYGDWALYGYNYAVDAVKSLMIVMALVDRKISVEQAVDLARLEQQYQTQKWGNVEWYHDIDVYELRTRLAASTLFVHWCSENTSIKQKASFAR